MPSSMYAGGEHRHPGGEVLRHALRRSSASRRALERLELAAGHQLRQLRHHALHRSRRSSRRCAWLSSGGRRLLTSQREARSTRVRISIRIRVCTLGVELVVVGASAPRAAAASRRSRGPRSWRGSARRPWRRSRPASRGQKVMPAPLTRSLTTWVTMISRRSGCSLDLARGSPRASASGSRPIRSRSRYGSSGRSEASSSSASTILVQASSTDSSGHGQRAAAVEPAADLAGGSAAPRARG